MYVEGGGVGMNGFDCFFRKTQCRAYILCMFATLLRSHHKHLHDTAHSRSDNCAGADHGAPADLGIA